MNTITRYTIEQEMLQGYDVIEEEDGEFVLYEDIKHLLEEDKETKQ